MAGWGKKRKLKLFVGGKHQSTQLLGFTENRRVMAQQERRPKLEATTIVSGKLNSVTKNLLRAGL